jgi:hypothetical protein
MTSTAAVIVALHGERYEACLASLSGFDRIHLLTDDPDILAAVRRRGMNGQLIGRPPCIESIGSDILGTSSEEWLLLIDPDEEFVCADPSAFRSVLANTPSDIAGYGIPYEIRAFGTPLLATYAELRKTKLVRPLSVRWRDAIHALPTPVAPHHRFIDFPGTGVSIVSELIADVATRLSRHVQWASIEATDLGRGVVTVDEIASRMGDVLHEYFQERACVSDGTAGILNGLLHLNKTIATLLFRASIGGVADDDTETKDALGRHVRQLANALRGEKGRSL